MDAVQEVKSRLSIEDVISEYVRLKRMGKNYKGLSPFTNEKTPSFVVSPEKQIWHDFSSGKGGDMFTFVQEVEGLDFKGSLELLARKAGVDLDQFRSSQSKSGPSRERLESALDLATRFFQNQLKVNNQALEYLLVKREYSKETLLEFRLGYSPDNFDSLTKFLTDKGYSEQEIILAGLAVKRRSGVGDMFRGRIMVPLCDPFGKTVGFTARILKDVEGAPKYINTPSTPLYDKSRHIFGLHLAKQAIRDKKYSVLVEGNMDVVASHQAGEKQVVATAGTALTEQQLKSLSRFSDDVRIAFDADIAGLQATERAIPIASKTKVNLKVIVLPEGKDPDELIKKDPNAWSKAIDESEYATDWLIEKYRKQLDISKAEDKRKLSDIIIDVIRGIQDPVEQDHYLTILSELLGVSKQSLSKKLASSSSSAQPLRRTNAQNANKQNPQAEIERKRAIDHLLGLALMMPGTRGYLDKVTVDMLTDENQKKLLVFLQENPSFDGSLADVESLREIGDYVKILSLQFEELYGAVDTLELQFEAARLRTRTIEYYTRQKKKVLVDKMANANENEQRKMLEEVKVLDALRNDTKEL